MIPPIGNEISALASQNREANIDPNAHQGAPAAAPVETPRATPQAEPAASSNNNEQNFDTASRLKAENRPVTTALETAQQASDTVRQVLDALQNAPSTALGAQGAGSSQNVLDLLSAPAPG